MKSRGQSVSGKYVRALISILLLGSVSSVFALEELPIDENCSVSILNRVVQASSNGGFSLPNVPSTQGQVRARVTCVNDGLTTSGQTEYFSVANNGITPVGTFFTGDDQPIPVSLSFTHTGNDPVSPGTPDVLLSGEGANFAVSVEALYSDDSVEEVTLSSSGINYSTSNEQTISVSPNGLLTANGSGRVLITVRKDGVVSGFIARSLVSGDTDGDGLPDDYEIANALNPEDPVDAFEDQDSDGLSALDEFNAGTDVNDADSDDDGIEDGEEMQAGNDGFITNPLLSDTDGDGIRDLLEINVGSDPTDENSFDLGASLAGLIVTPNNFDVTVNSIDGETSVQLSVSGILSDGFTIDLTATNTGTNYSPADLTICGLGARSGQIFATSAGACEVTVSNSGFSSNVNLNVSVFRPAARSFLNLGQTGATNVDVEGNYAYVSSVNSGLTIVDVLDKDNPTVVTSISTKGSANDIKVINSIAYIANGNAGLRLIDVSDPGSPTFISQLDTDGTANDLVVKDRRVYLADGEAGIKIIDVNDPFTPTLVNSISTSGPAIGIDLSSSLAFAVVVVADQGIQIIRTADEADLTVLSNLTIGLAKDVRVKGDHALVASQSSSFGFTTVDLSNLSEPIISARVPRSNGGLLSDVEFFDNRAIGADFFFFNGVPIIDVTQPAIPQAQAILDFSSISDDNGVGVAMTNQYIYMVSGIPVSRLFIGQYRKGFDEDGDGLMDQEELELGTNFNNSDTDNDGLDDGYEVTNNLDPVDPDDALTADTDSDGLFDLDELNTHQTDPEKADTDSDQIDDGEEINTYFTDPLRKDTDVDGANDFDEIFTYSTDPLNADTDNDGLFDGHEINNNLDPLNDSDAVFADSDGDTLSDLDEFNIYLTDPLNVDTDFDRLKDGYEINNGLNPIDASDASTAETDGDTLLDLNELFLYGSNPLLVDTDGDTLSDGDEVRTFGTDPTLLDTDGDGVNDNDELQTFNTNPLVVDTDEDGLSDGDELLVHNTDPLIQDTDLDLISDGFEIRFGLNPTNANDAALDPDNDGLTNLEEFQLGLDPLVFNSDTPPRVANIKPLDGSINFPFNRALVVRFTESLSAASVVPGTVTLTENGNTVDGSLMLSGDGLSITFTPQNDLIMLTEYQVSVQGVQDSGGNTMVGNTMSTFVTSEFADIDGNPSVIVTNPTNNETNVSVNSVFSVEFDNCINPASLTPANFILRDVQIDQRIAGMIQVDPDGLKASFVPEQQLPVGRSIEAHLTTNIQDLSGNALNQEYFVDFTTGFLTDQSSPSFIGANIADNATNIPINAVVMLRFDEPINLIDAIRGINVSESGGATIPGSFALDDGNRRITFTPASNFQANTQYTVTFTTNIKDVAGNALFNPSGFVFQTSDQEDNQLITVETEGILPPVSQDFNVPINLVAIHVPFSEQVNPVSFTPSTFRLLEIVGNEEIIVPGNVVIASDGMSANYELNTELSPSSKYSFRISGIQDIAGNIMQGGRGINFFTGLNADNTAPNIEISSIVNGMTDVPSNVIIRWTLDEAFSNLDSNNIDLQFNGSSIGGVLAASGNGFSFTPLQPLVVGSYTLTLQGLTDLAGNSIDSVTTVFNVDNSSIDNTSPFLISSIPADNDIGVAVLSPIIMTFTENIDPNVASIGVTTKVPYGGGGITFSEQVEGQITVTDNIVTFTPSTPYPVNTPVVVTLSRIGDFADNELSFSTFSFTTELNNADTTAPTVLSINPANGATEISPESPLVVLFSEPMNPFSFVSGEGEDQNFPRDPTIGIYIDGVQQRFSIFGYLDARSVLLTPRRFFANWGSNSVVDVLLTSGITDISGNPITQFESQFTTGAIDLEQPKVEVQRPHNGATGVATDSSIVLFISEPIETTSVNDGLVVSENGIPVTGSLSFESNNQVLTFTPDSAFEANSVIDVFMTNLVTDTGGNSIVNYQGTFLTSENPNNQAAMIVAQHPENNSTDVTLNTFIDLQFSEPLDNLTVNNTTIKLLQGTQEQEISVDLLENNDAIRISPIDLLAADTQYTISLDGVLDQNRMLIMSYTSSFTTGTETDVVAPIVISVSPPNNGVGIGTNASIRLRVNEAMNPLTVNKNTVMLMDGTSEVIVSSLIFSNDNRDVQIIPHEPLAATTTYSIIIDQVEDRAGNLIMPITTTFITGFDPDFVSPELDQISFLNSGTIPTPDAVDVPLNTVVEIRVTEPIDVGTINETTFMVRDMTTQSPIAGTYSVSGNGLEIAFTPDVPLGLNQNYSVEFCNRGILDVSGNLLMGSVSDPQDCTGIDFSFTTGSVADTTSPQSLQVYPVDGSINHPRNGGIFVQFDEPVNITESNFTVTDGFTSLGLQPRLFDGNRRLSLIQSPYLDPLTTYTFTLMNVKDYSGNVLMGEPITTTFTTGTQITPFSIYGSP